MRPGSIRSPPGSGSAGLSSAGLSSAEDMAPLRLELLVVLDRVGELEADLLAQETAHAVEVVGDVALGDAVATREGLVARRRGRGLEVVLREDAPLDGA